MMVRFALLSLLLLSACNTTYTGKNSRAAQFLSWREFMENSPAVMP